jgi:hypothetical protein
VPVDEIVKHALAYYLADLDQGRVAARTLRPEAPGAADTPTLGAVARSS